MEFRTNKPLSEIHHDFVSKQQRCENLENEWKLLMTESEIQLCCSHVAKQINEKFRNSEKPIVLTAILKGAYLFLADLTKKLTIPYSVYFIEASSYANKQTQQEELQLLSKLIPEKFHGKTVILVDELFDNGKTMSSIKEHLLSTQELKLKKEDIFACTIFTKDSGTDIPEPDFIGIKKIPPVWLVGYGLDDQGEKRGWPLLYACPKAEGVARTFADKIFDHNTEADAVYGQIRDSITKQLGEICAQNIQ